MNTTVLIIIGALVVIFMYVAMKKPAPVNTSTSAWLAGLIPLAAAGVAAYKSHEDSE
jgi:hypothetical protein